MSREVDRRRGAADSDPSAESSPVESRGTRSNLSPTGFPVATDATTLVFPITIEVQDTSASIDTDALIEQVLSRIADNMDGE